MLTMEPRKIGRYGWKMPLPGPHRPKFATHRTALDSASLPQSVDLRPYCPSVYDQMTIGSCTSNALGGAVEFAIMKEGKPPFVPSRLFIYWNERSMEGTIDSDSGAAIADGVTVLKTLGTPHESLWWYNPDKFTVKPNHAVYVDALKHKVGSALSIDNTQLAELQTPLSQGLPVVIGFTVYESFESDAVAKTGHVPMPKTNEKQIGGHAVGIFGYSNEYKIFICRNSWGPNWGLKGYFTMPYDYVTSPDLCSDCWVLENVI